MPESDQHIKLVKAIYNWIKDNKLKGDHGAIYIDSPSSSLSHKPPRILNYFPDIYVRDSSNRGPIVGEAKSAYDLDNKHTYQQIKSFLQWCSLFEKSLLIIAVPWDLERLARSIMYDIRNKLDIQNVEVIVLERALC